MFGINPLMMAPAEVVWSTWNPLDKNAAITLSSGNRVATGGNTYTCVRSTLSKSSGKLYVEFGVAWPTNTVIGVANFSASLSSAPGADANGYGYIGDNGVIYKGGSAVAVQDDYPYASNYYISIAVDFSDEKIWFAKNGTFVGNPATNSGGYTISGMGALYLICAPAAGTLTLNAGQSAFAYTPPSGFTAWG